MCRNFKNKLTTYMACQITSHIETIIYCFKNKPLPLYTVTYMQINKKSTRIYEEVYCMCMCHLQKFKPIVMVVW